MAKPDSAGVHVPPPLIYAACFLLGVLVQRATPGWTLPPEVRVPGLALAIIGLAFGFSAIGYFLVRKTTLIPNRPASKMVCEGPFAICRNPMYLGLATAYVGLDLFFRLVWPLAMLPVALAIIDRKVIAPEEAYLERAFGEEYRAYCRRVGRWMPWVKPRP